MRLAIGDSVPLSTDTLLRSTHNVRIERLWLEVNRVIIHKWRSFFEQLEEHHGLNHDIPSHLWLLHHLFLPMLNRDLSRWVEHWNAHVIQLKNERNKSPQEIFFFGMLENQVPGILDVIHDGEREGSPEVENLDVGLDVMDMLEEMNDETIATEIRARTGNPFEDYVPTNFSVVRCEAPDCPLLPDQLEGLNSILRAEFDIRTTSMAVRQTIWRRAMVYCSALFV